MAWHLLPRHFQILDSHKAAQGDILDWNMVTPIRIRENCIKVRSFHSPYASEKIVRGLLAILKQLKGIGFAGNNVINHNRIVLEPVSRAQR